MTSLRLASCAREFAGLKAFFAEHRAPLGWLERHRRFLAAVRTRCDRFNPFPGTATGAAGRPRSAFGLAGFAALWFVLEILVGEELLFSRRPDELRATVYAPEQPVLELHWSLPRRVGLASLLRFSPELLTITLARQRLFGAAFITGFQIEGVLLDVFDDVFLLNLPLEPAESAFNRFALLNLYFRHLRTPPLRVAIPGQPDFAITQIC
ncbi:MAG TPA: hypothetical protein VL282_00650 [Tepidisphaeraceae bacterium]|nr:hypothetical protein [Tepidisphaeraceae bacterium]